MDNLITLLCESTLGTGFWQTIISWFYDFIGNFGWTIIVFTICLKIVLMPLDIWQRHIAMKTSEKQEEMQPELEAINKAYANDRDKLNQKTMEIYRAHNFNMMGSCFGLLVNLVLTIVIFFSLFSNLQKISANRISNEYENLKTVYTTSITNGKTEEEAQEEVFNYYENELKESWLWIKNIYLPDTSVTPFPQFNAYVNSAKISFKGYTEENKYYSSVLNTSEYESDKVKELMKSEYELVTAKISQNYQGKWNGLFIIVVLSGLVTWLSSKISKMGQQKKQQVDANGNPMPDSSGVMTIILPIIMVYFTLSYTSIFSIYIVTNSLMSVLITFVYTKVRKTMKANYDKKVANGDITPDKTVDYRVAKYKVVDQDKNDKK